MELEGRGVREERLLAFEAVFEKYKQAIEAAQRERERWASAETSWSIKREIAGFQKDGETLEYDGAYATDVARRYKQSIGELEEAVKRWERALLQTVKDLAGV